MYYLQVAKNQGKKWVSASLRLAHISFFRVQNYTKSLILAILKSNDFKLRHRQLKHIIYHHYTIIIYFILAYIIIFRYFQKNNPFATLLHFFICTFALGNWKRSLLRPPHRSASDKPDFHILSFITLFAQLITQSWSFKGDSVILYKTIVYG